MRRLIFVSDDEPTVADSLSRIGQALDVTVVADTQARVVERARTDKPDLVVLDIQQRDGLELLTLLKTGRTTRDIPVVVIAREDKPDLRDLALEIGADGFISKPLGRDFLAKLLTFLSAQS